VRDPSTDVPEAKDFALSQGTGGLDPVKPPSRLRLRTAGLACLGGRCEERVNVDFTVQERFSEQATGAYYVRMCRTCR
jgi:hypothetical protein